MRVRTAQEYDLLGPAPCDIGDKFPTAAQPAVVLLAQDRRANAVLVAGGTMRHQSPPPMAKVPELCHFLHNIGLYTGDQCARPL